MMIIHLNHTVGGLEFGVTIGSTSTWVWGLEFGVQRYVDLRTGYDSASGATSTYITSHVGGLESGDTIATST